MKTTTILSICALMALSCASCQSEPLPQPQSTYPCTILWTHNNIAAAGFAVDYIDSTGTNGVRIGGSPVLAGTNYSLSANLTNGTIVTVWATNSIGIASYPNPTAVFHASVPAIANNLTVQP